MESDYFEISSDPSDDGKLWLAFANDSYGMIPPGLASSTSDLEVTDTEPASVLSEQTTEECLDTLPDASDAVPGGDAAEITREQVKEVLYKDMIRLVSQEIALSEDGGRLCEAIRLSVNALVDGDLVALRNALTSCGSEENFRTLKVVLERMLDPFAPEIRMLHWPNSNDILRLSVANGFTAGIPSASVLSVERNDSNQSVTLEEQRTMELFSRALCDGIRNKNWNYNFMEKDELVSRASRDIAALIDDNGHLNAGGRTVRESSARRDLCIHQAFQRASELGCTEELVRQINRELSGKNHFVVLGEDYSTMGRYPLANQRHLVNVSGHTLIVVNRDTSIATDHNKIRSVRIVARYR